MRTYKTTCPGDYVVFNECPTCGLEWRALGTGTYCTLTLAGYNKMKADCDQARDWCRKLVVLVRAKSRLDNCEWRLCSNDKCERPICVAYRALPPELRAAIEA